MSLLTKQMEAFTMQDKTTAPDGYGGTKTVWVDGAGFPAAVVLNDSIEARRAEKEGVRNVYDIITRKNVLLMYGDVCRRDSDGKLFRITGDGTDLKTPVGAGLNMRKVSAEELDALPGGNDDG